MAALVFAAVHAVAISDIWFSTVPMMVAGAICGACLAWAHDRVVGTPTLRSWVRFNLLYVLALGLLGLASVVVFEPRSTIAELIAADAPPDELIGAAMPLTVGFTLATAVLVNTVHGSSWRTLWPVVVTTVVVVALLGLNVSVIGLVEIPVGAVYLVAELFGLVIVLAAVHTAVYAVLERERLTATASRRDARGRLEPGSSP